MNLKKYTIFAVPLIAVFAVLTFSTNAEVTSPDEPRVEATLAEFGIVVTENNISDNAPTKIAKFVNTSLDLLKIQEDLGYVYYLYGSQHLDTNSDVSLVDFVENGGVVVRSIVMTNPAVALKHIDQEADNYFVLNGMSAFWDEGNEYHSSSVRVYPGDERKITVMATGDKNSIVELVKELNLEPSELDLEKYPEIVYSPEPIFEG